MSAHLFDNKLVIGISSRALFNLDESHRIFEEQGVEAYREYQVAHEDDILSPGDAFPLVKKLLAINQHLKSDRVEVILLSRNTSDTGLRVFNSIEHFKLKISRAVFTGGRSPYKYVSALGVHLFLSTNQDDVARALAENFPAATILHSAATGQSEDETLRIAFDGDAVLFSDESERLYQQSGLSAFTEAEKQKAKEPLLGGPFKPFLTMLTNLQKNLPDSVLRTALVTARSAPAHERVIRTLRAWGIAIDESLFLGGLEKGPFLKAFNADIFFDDQSKHCESAREHVATGHVPHGIMNEKQ